MTREELRNNIISLGGEDIFKSKEYISKAKAQEIYDSLLVNESGLDIPKDEVNNEVVTDLPKEELKEKMEENKMKKCKLTKKQKAGIKIAVGATGAITATALLVAKAPQVLIGLGLAAIGSFCSGLFAAGFKESGAVDKIKEAAEKAKSKTSPAQ